MWQLRGNGTSGCTDEMSCNYDPNASCDDGGCLYLVHVEIAAERRDWMYRQHGVQFDPNATCAAEGADV